MLPRPSRTVPGHVQRSNEFIGSVDRQRFIPFGTVHPDLPVAENLASLRDNGIRGVKLHPLFQQLSLADPASSSSSPRWPRTGS